MALANDICRPASPSPLYFLVLRPKVRQSKDADLNGVLLKLNEIVVEVIELLPLSLILDEIDDRIDATLLELINWRDLREVPIVELSVFVAIW